LSVFHGIRQCPQGVQDNLAELYPKKENKREKRKGGKQQYKGDYGEFGFG